MAKPLADLFQLYSRNVLRITTRNAHGDLSSGTGFHIGDGYVVTARHVVQNRPIAEIAPYKDDSEPKCRRIVYPRDERIDLAVLETDFSLANFMKLTTIIGTDGKPAPKADHIPLGGHLDDWLGDELVLSKGLVMGYPIVPTSNDAVLVAVEAEVNAVVDKYTSPHPHFVLSYLARGGFSGAPAISEYGFLLGVVTESLCGPEQSTETGFAVALSVEPLLVLLRDNAIFPGENGRFIKDLLPD